MMGKRVAVLLAAGSLLLAAGAGPATAATVPQPVPATPSATQWAAPSATQWAAGTSPAPVSPAEAKQLRLCLDAAMSGTSQSGCERYRDQIAALRLKLSQAKPAPTVAGTPRFTG